MKNIFISLLFISLMGVFYSQNKLVWHEDLGEAVAASQKEDKPILFFFTGSDWCTPCRRLQKEVFSKPTFAEWATENVVLLELDYPRNKTQSKELKEQNEMLYEQFDIDGYPTVWIAKAKTDSFGEAILSSLNFENGLARTGYVTGGPEAWITAVEEELRSE